MSGLLSIQHLLVILLIVVLVFGTKKLRTIGGDLGGAIKAFRKSMDEPQQEEDAPKLEARSDEATTLNRNEHKTDSPH